jgi:hypothetical protein
MKSSFFFFLTTVEIHCETICRFSKDLEALKLHNQLTRSEIFVAASGSRKRIN